MCQEKIVAKKFYQQLNLIIWISQFKKNVGFFMKNFLGFVVEQCYLFGIHV